MLALDVHDFDAPPGVRTVVGDVSDPAVAEATVRDAVDTFGALHVLANVAGILRTAHTHEHSIEVWDRVLAINLTGTFLMCRAAIPALLDAGGGAIVNTSSTAALSGHPWAAAYSASKGGVLAFTKVIAVEYAKRGIRANAVCPGSIDTPITSDFDFPEGADMKLLHRIMSITKPQGPEVVAAAIAYLASDDAVHVNGESLRDRRRHARHEVLHRAGLQPDRPLRAAGEGGRRARLGHDRRVRSRRQPRDDHVGLPVHQGRRPPVGAVHAVGRPVGGDRRHGCGHRAPPLHHQRLRAADAHPVPRGQGRGDRGCAVRRPGGPRRRHGVDGGGVRPPGAALRRGAASGPTRCSRCSASSGPVAGSSTTASSTTSAGWR